MKKIEFIQQFRAQAAQLHSYAIAGDWMRLAERLASQGITLTSEQAALWATSGYLPSEAEPLIRDGMHPNAAAEMDRLSTDLAGGSDQRAAQRIDDLVRGGVVVNPSRVRWYEDPDDPAHVIVRITPEP